MLDDAWPLQLADRTVAGSRRALTPGREDLRTAAWSPYNPRSRAWASGSLLMLAREQRLTDERIQRASTPHLVPARAAQSARITRRWLHSTSTESLRSQRWPRGELPMHEDDAADALSPALLTRPACRTTAKPAAELYPKRLPPATYFSGYSQSNPFSVRNVHQEARFPTHKGMIWT